MSSRTVTVRGVSSLVREAGPSEDREAVVFLHGNPGSSEDYSALLGPVGELARAIAPDMPGYGKADRPQQFDYTVDGYATHLDGLLEQLNVERVHLVLHDFGGAWGIRWALSHPEKVASFVLLNVGLLPGYKWHKFARIWRTPLLGELFQLLTNSFGLKALLNGDNPKPFPEAFIERIYQDSDWSMRRAVLRLYRATDDFDELARLAEQILAPLNLPALVIWGEQDRYLPVRFAAKQQDYFDAEIHTLRNTGHWPMIDEPERVRELMIRFLSGQVGRSRAAP